jgi:hypothetical protein
VKPAAPRDVRRHNLSLVLREVAERGPRSRATIALDTGLNKTTVSSLVAELIELGLLRDSGPERPGAVGRPAQRVEIDPAGPFAVGLEVDVDYLAAEATDLADGARHQSFARSDDPAEPKDVLGHLLMFAEQALEQPRASGPRAEATTVAAPDLVDAAGRLVVAPNLHWLGQDCAESVLASGGVLVIRVRRPAR